MFLGTLHRKKTIIRRFHYQIKHEYYKLGHLKFPNRIALLSNEYKWIFPPDKILFGIIMLSKKKKKSKQVLSFQMNKKI